MTRSGWCANATNASPAGGGALKVAEATKARRGCGPRGCRSTETEMRWIPARATASRFGRPIFVRVKRAAVIIGAGQDDLGKARHGRVRGDVQRSGRAHAPPSPVRATGAGPTRRGAREWEHEEYDERGALVAVYESWTMRSPVPPGADLAVGVEGFVKYSPYGWPLRRSGAPLLGGPVAAAAAARGRRGRRAQGARSAWPLRTPGRPDSRRGPAGTSSRAEGDSSQHWSVRRRASASRPPSLLGAPAAEHFRHHPSPGQ